MYHQMQPVGMCLKLIPPRQSYALQTAELIRQQIRTGAWTGTLPPERTLSKRLQIARNTLRQALTTLEAEGYISPITPDRRRRILRKPRTSSITRIRQVVFLSPDGLSGLLAHGLAQVDILRTHLADAGYHFDVITSRAFQVEHPDGLLHELAGKWPGAIWVLYHSTKAVQDWFTRQQLPAIILGHPHPGVNLPFIDEDIAAAARHAVGRLWSMGHRHIILVRPRRELGGHLVAEEAVREMLTRKGLDADQPVSILHDGSLRGICRVIDQHLNAHPPPLAFLTMLMGDTITVLMHLTRRGMHVPETVSLIHLFGDPIHQYLIPPVDHYEVQSARLVKRLCGMILALADGSRGRIRPVRIICEYCPGETVGPGGLGSLIEPS